MAYVKNISQQGYKANSPDRNRPYNIIPSGQITMKNVPHEVDAYNRQGKFLARMQPGGNYNFPVREVVEIPVRQTGGDVLTYKDNADWFDSHAVYHDNPQYDKMIREKVYSGNYGYNPTTGVVSPLDKNQQANIPKEVSDLRTLEKTQLAERERLSRLSPEERKTHMKRMYNSDMASQGKSPFTVDDIGGRLNEWDPNIYGDTYDAKPWEGKSGETLYLTDAQQKDYYKDWTAKSMQEVGRNPLFYAPGMIGMGLGAIPANIMVGAGSTIGSLAQGNYKDAAITGALTALPFVPAALKGVRNVARSGLQRALPKYETVLRVEPAKFTPKGNNPNLTAEQNLMEGRWFGTSPEEAAFYIKNSKDPLANEFRIMQKRMPVKKIAKKYQGENMPDAAKQMSVGHGKFKSYKEMGEFYGMDQKQLMNKIKTDPKFANDPSHYHPNELILPMKKVDKLRKKGFVGTKDEAMMKLSKMDVKKATPLKVGKYEVPREYVPWLGKEDVPQGILNKLGLNKDQWVALGAQHRTKKYGGDMNNSNKNVAKTIKRISIARKQQGGTAGMNQDMNDVLGNRKNTMTNYLRSNANAAVAEEELNLIAEAFDASFAVGGNTNPYALAYQEGVNQRRQDFGQFAGALGQVAFNQDPYYKMKVKGPMKDMIKKGYDYQGYDPNQDPNAFKANFNANAGQARFGGLPKHQNTGVVTGGRGNDIFTEEEWAEIKAADWYDEPLDGTESDVWTNEDGTPYSGNGTGVATTGGQDVSSLAQRYKNWQSEQDVVDNSFTGGNNNNGGGGGYDPAAGTNTGTTDDGSANTGTGTGVRTGNYEGDPNANNNNGGGYNNGNQAWVNYGDFNRRGVGRSGMPGQIAYDPSNTFLDSYDYKGRMFGPGARKVKMTFSHGPNGEVINNQTGQPAGGNGYPQEYDNMGNPIGSQDPNRDQFIEDNIDPTLQSKKQHGDISPEEQIEWQRQYDEQAGSYDNSRTRQMNNAPNNTPVETNMKTKFQNWRQERGAEKDRRRGQGAGGYDSGVHPGYDPNQGNMSQQGQGQGDSRQEQNKRKRWEKQNKRIERRQGDPNVDVGMDEIRQQQQYQELRDLNPENMPMQIGGGVNPYELMMAMGGDIPYYIGGGAYDFNEASNGYGNPDAMMDQSTVTWKRRMGINPEEGVMAGITGMEAASSLLNSRQDAANKLKMQEFTSADAQNEAISMEQSGYGTYDENQGTMRDREHVAVRNQGINMEGDIGSSNYGKYGGSMLKQGGEYEMDEAQLREFLAAGGQVQYID